MKLLSHRLFGGLLVLVLCVPLFLYFSVTKFLIPVLVALIALRLVLFRHRYLDFITVTISCYAFVIMRSVFEFWAAITLAVGFGFIVEFLIVGKVFPRFFRAEC